MPFEFQPTGAAAPDLPPAVPDIPVAGELPGPEFDTTADTAPDMTRPPEAGPYSDGTASTPDTGSPDITRPPILDSEATSGHGASVDNGNEGMGGNSAESDDEPDPANADLTPPVPPGSDLAGRAENPDDGKSEGQRAYEAFESRAEDRPTADDIQQLQDKQTAVDWLGSPGDSSAAVAFGGKLESSHQPLDSLPPGRPDEIVDRQLERFSDTLTRIHEAVEATRDLADITRQQSGRAEVRSNEVGNMSSIGISFYGRFAVTLSATGELDVAESWPGTGGQHEAVMHSTPEGEIHLVKRNAEQRHVIRVEESRAVTVAENIYAVKPDDSQYFSDLNRDLAAYENLLVQAAEHAGFNRAEMTRPDGNFDRDFLNERVNPVVANPEFADVLPPRLVADMMRLTHSLAMRLNPPEHHAGSITPRAYRLTNYFNTALGNRRS